MIGTLDPRSKHVTVVGAGISGLLIAYSLKKRGYQVSVLEASNRVGGLIETKQTPHGPAESAAHSLMVNDTIQKFFDELGVELVPVNEDSRARYIFRDGKMRRMPLRFMEILGTLIRFFSKPKAVIDREYASLAEWCEAYLGKPALRFLLAPFVTGVFAATPEELNLKIAFPKLVPAKPHTSLFNLLFTRSGKKAPRPRMMTPKGGMGLVIEKLQAELKNEIKLNHPIHQLPNVPNLILSVPTHSLAKLISESDPASAETLLQVSYAPLVTITAFFKNSSFKKHPPRGVGVLIPRSEGIRILGVLFNSSAFPGRTHQADTSSLTVMVGGSTDPEALELDQTQLSDLIYQELATLLGLTERPLHLEITPWSRAIPIYSNGLKNAQESLKRGFCLQPGRIVFTNFSKEVSIRGMIDALQQI